MREWVQAPWITLCESSTDTQCTPIEDCDGKATALGALLRCAGLKVRVLHIKYYGGAQDHVSIAVETEKGWMEADSTIDKELGPPTKNAKVTMIDPFDPKYVPSGEGAGMFVGVGLAYAGHGDITPTLEVGAAAAPTLGTFQSVTDNAVHAGLRYRIGLQLTFTTDPTGNYSLQQQARVYFQQKGWVLEALDQQAAANPITNSGDTTYEAPFILQGISTTDQTLANDDFANYLVLGVQSATSNPPAPGAAPLTVTSPQPSTFNVGYGAALLVTTGAAAIAWGGWRIYKRSRRV
jgi:hypothetical protein